MRFALICIDRPGHLEVRRGAREAHLAYVRETGVVELGGPFLDEAGEMAGSLLILEVADIEAAREWAAKDPYAHAGLFERSEIRPWKRVIG